MEKTQKAWLNLIFLSFFLLMSLTSRDGNRVKADEPLPLLQIVPSPYLVENASQPFSLNLSITNVTDLYGWEVKIYYPKTILECVEAVEGDFLQSAGNTFWISPIIDNSYNATCGRVLLACSLYGMIPGANGSGVLATVTFQAIGGGVATLHLADTKLADSQVPTHNPIPHTTVDGTVDVSTFHNIVVTHVYSLKTVIGQGYFANISVTVENRGTSTETFNVTIYANDVFVAKEVVVLPEATIKTVTILWNTAGWPYENRTIVAVADTVLGETQTTDNTLRNGWAIVTIPGDLDGNYWVQLADLVILARAYGSKLDETKWNPNADIDNDAIVGLSDLVIMAWHYGEHYP